MKRLVYIISTFLILTGMCGGIVGADSIFKFFQTGGSAAIDIIGGAFGLHIVRDHRWPIRIALAADCPASSPGCGMGHTDRNHGMDLPAQAV